jgi:hypothetical protein
MVKVKAMLACVLIAGMTMLSACAHGSSRTVPSGVILASAPPYATVGGVRTGGAVDPSCCWVEPDSTFGVRKDGPATDLAVTLYVPSYPRFERFPQAIEALVEGRRVGSRCCLAPGLHTVLFRLPAELRDRTGAIPVALHARVGIVPAREHTGPETDTLAFVLVSVSFGTYWSGRF